MKGKRYSTEDKIRILRQADRGQTIGEVNEAKRFKELERENPEFKKMLAESLLKNRVLEFVCEKKL